MLSFKDHIKELSKPKEIDIWRKRHADPVDLHAQRADQGSSWATHAHNYMRNYGFEPIGQGAAGSVYANSKYPFIIKIFRTDLAYQRWIKFCLQHPENDYLPKFRGKLIRINQHFHAVRVEKLKPINSSLYHAFSEELADYMEGKKNEDEELLEIAVFLNANEKLLDLHSGNYMQRGSTPILIDPLYNFFKAGKNMISRA